MRQKGFTILEIVVVIGIILVILGFVLVYLPSIRNKANDTTIQSESQRISLALEKYFLLCGQYPVDASQSIDLSANNGCSGSTTFGSVLGASVTVPHTYIPLSLSEASGDCQLGYILAFPVSATSALLDGDADFVLTGSAVPYFCTSAGTFDGTDSNSLYDLVQPSSLAQ